MENIFFIDYIDKDISHAIDKYLEFLEEYPQSIFYDEIRIRIRNENKNTNDNNN